MRKMNIPVFDIDAINSSPTAYEEKTTASIAKAAIEWFMRVAGYEDVYREGLTEMCPYGDNYLVPFTVPVEGEGCII